MNQQDQARLSNRYLEFKSTSSKIGLEEALFQFKTIGQEDWRFELLCELYFVQSQVQTQQVDRVSKLLRSSLRLLSSENFLKENGILVYEILELFDDIEQGNAYKYLLEGIVHLPTRCELVKGLNKHQYLEYKDILDYLLHSGHKLTSKYSIQLSEMIYTVIEDNPFCVFMVRFKLVEMQILPDLVTRLTVLYCCDEIDFLNGLFYRMPAWFIAQSVNSGQFIVKMKHRIIAEIESYSSDLQSHQVELASSIRALTGVIGYFGIKLSELEVDLCLKILASTEMERLVKLLLSLVIIAGDQFLKRQKELSNVLGQLLHSEVSEMPLLILVYFQTDNIQQVEDIVRNVLMMQVPIPKLGLFEIQKLFRSIKSATLSR
ncbi:hypothetical protein K501DRAFT_251843 [Backusella circina FSU 941]|nr:hypothetical protein K501DRAFT_251843 [Backusella circina FSU 941]